MMKRKCARVAASVVVATACLAGMSGAAQAEGSCPSGYGLVIEEGARIHRSSDLRSPVDGVFFNSHSYRVLAMMGGSPTTPEWVKLNDTTTGVTGFVHGSVAGCAGLTHPSGREPA